MSKLSILGHFWKWALPLAGVMLPACSTSLAQVEDWPGVQKGGLRQNASQVDIEPTNLKIAWGRSFKANPLGDQSAPQNEMKLASGRGSYNLVMREGKIALIGQDTPEGFPEGYYTVVLDSASGATLNNIAVRSNSGHERVYRWPYNTVSMSGDTAPGIVNLSWDPQSGVLFIAQGAYNSAYTAYLPLANVSGHKAGQFQPGVPAFEYLDKHPNYEDAFGRKRSEYRTIFGITLNEPGLKPFAWGPSAFYSNIAEEKGKPVRYDKDWESLFGRQGSSYYNTSAFFSLDTEGPLMATTKGADWGHNIAGDAYIFNKHTGLKAVTEWPADPQHEGRRLRPFTSGGALIGNGRVFLAGPGEDRDGDGHLGIRRPEGLIPKVDQGLYLWAYDYSMADKRPGDGVTGPAALETASLKPAFVHRFLSRYQPDPNDIDSYGQSYYETDGFFRRKAMLIDGKSAWMAWKPSQADAVELIHADDKEARTWSLEVGKGLKGVDLWPKISLSEQGGSKTIAYYTGYAQYRKRVMVEDVEAELKKYTHKGNRWEDLSDGDRNGFIRQARETGVWSGELFAPRGPAELAIFDASQGKLKWTYNLSDNHSGLQPNDFWCFIDRSHMVVAGKHVYVGWVDTSGEEAALKLVALDMTADKPTPVERKLPLGFPSKGNEKSALFDLIAVDGTLYALVTQSENLWIRDPRWKSQWVVAVRP